MSDWFLPAGEGNCPDWSCVIWARLDCDNIKLVLHTACDIAYLRCPVGGNRALVLPPNLTAHCLPHLGFVPRTYHNHVETGTRKRAKIWRAKLSSRVLWIAPLSRLVAARKKWGSSITSARANEVRPWQFPTANRILPHLYPLSLLLGHLHALGPRWCHPR